MNKTENPYKIPECSGYYKGFPYVVMITAQCFRVGYVGIPKDHKYYGKRYNELRHIECHGCLTYSAKTIPWQEDEDICWWVGFDCRHSYDGYDIVSALETFKDCPETMSFINRNLLFMKSVNVHKEVRTLDYCIEQCKKIIDQICEV